MNNSIEALSFRFTLNAFLGELRHEEAHFEQLDRLYSEFLAIQTHHIRFLHRLGDISAEERNRRWAEVDAQEKEWEERFSDWRVERFQLQEAISRLQAKLRDLYKPREVARVAA